jgi:hypothetical protein
LWLHQPLVLDACLDQDVLKEALLSDLFEDAGVSFVLIERLKVVCPSLVIGNIRTASLRRTHLVTIFWIHLIPIGIEVASRALECSCWQIPFNA